MLFNTKQLKEMQYLLASITKNNYNNILQNYKPCFKRNNLPCIINKPVS
jgi:hypothetical protein